MSDSPASSPDNPEPQAEPAAGTQSAEPPPPSPFSGAPLWMLRGLTLAGLTIGLFLAGVHLARLLVVRFSETPFCGFAPNWFDCGAVLFNERWSEWLGIPVAFPAVGLYALLTVAVFALGPNRGPAATRRWWGLVQFAAGCIALAALWFIVIQARFINEFCLYCMAEHGIGLLLAFQVWALSGRLRGEASPGWRPTLLALAAVLVLIVGQFMNQPTHTRSMVGEFEETSYTESPPGPGRAVSLMGGAVTLDRDLHLYLGDPEAPHVAVEVIDYTCPRCRRLFQTLEQAKADLGPDYAVLVLTFPLNGDCNHLISYETGDQHAEACDLARLAHAVWLTDADRFPEFHRWLFENQDGMTLDAAKDKAAELVGRSHLLGTMTLDRLDKLIPRDVEIGKRLKVRQLPGLYAGSRRFSNVPSQPATLAAEIRKSFEETAEAATAPPNAPPER